LPPWNVGPPRRKKVDDRQEEIEKNERRFQIFREQMDDLQNKLKNRAKDLDEVLRVLQDAMHLFHFGVFPRNHCGLYDPRYTDDFYEALDTASLFDYWTHDARPFKEIFELSVSTMNKVRDLKKTRQMAR